MGQVYLAQDTRIDREVAIKVIQSEMNSYPDDEATRDAVRLFHREAQTIAKLNHPHILPLFDFDEASSDGSVPTYMVMPYCSEGSFAEWLRQRKERGMLPPQDIVQLVRQAADALQYAHDHGIIHRDVKPANFLIRSHRENPNCPDLLLADFGVAKLNAATTRSSQNIRGTPNYMSPEQWSGAPVPATDQYALAVMVYELLTGRAPFQGNANQVMYQHLMVQPPPPSTFNSHLPPSVDAVLLRALAKDPSARFPSISDFGRAFQQALLPELPQSSYGAYAPAYTLPPALSQPSYTTLRTPDSSPSPMASMAVPIAGANQREIISSKPSRSFRGRTILLIGLALLVILAGVSFSLVLLHQNGTGQTGTSIATTNRQNAGTVTATAGATIPATATATPSLAQVPNPYPPHRGTLVLDDPLHDNSRGYMWDTTNITGEASCGFMNSVYHATQVFIGGGITGCNPEALPILSDFTLQVQMTIVSGDAGGVTFRVIHSNYYLFAITPDGSYHFDVENGSSLSLPVVVRQGINSAIHKGLNQPNLIAVVAIGKDFSFYVNNHLVDTMTDGTFSSGQIGLAAEESSNATDVMFSNVKVWKM